MVSKQMDAGKHQVWPPRFLYVTLALAATALVTNTWVWVETLTCSHWNHDEIVPVQASPDVPGSLRRAWEEWNQVDVPVRWNGAPPPKTQLLDALALVASLPPSHPINQSCTPPPLDPQPTCTGGTGFTGTPLPSPRRIVHMALLGFETDTLEILLREEVDVVDVIFLVESTRSHNPQGQDPRATKPLMWDRLKHSPRFRFVPPDKVVHIVVDDAEMQRATSASVEDRFSVEDMQTRAGIDRVKHWAEATGHLSPTDIFISGDVDEVPSRSTLHRLRWCELKDPMVSSALWMPMGSLDRAYMDKRMALDLPYTFCSPTIYQWGSVLAGQHDGTRMTTYSTLRDQQVPYLLGGLHMTNAALMPNVMLKELSATSYGSKAPTHAYTQMLLDQEQRSRYALKAQPELWERVVPLHALGSQYDVWLRFLPWFLECNPWRYPYWFGHSDPRNQALLYAMKRLAAGEDPTIVQQLHLVNIHR
eukprot:jgi/Pico_ML_1/51864/g2688.t1